MVVVGGTIGGLILNLKDRFTEKELPVCKPYPHEPDIKIGCYKSGGYRLFCEKCGKRAQNAIPHTLHPDERENAVVLEPLS